MLQPQGMHWTVIFTEPYRWDRNYETGESDYVYYPTFLCYEHEGKEWKRITPTEFWEKYRTDFDLMSLVLPEPNSRHERM